MYDFNDILSRVSLRKILSYILYESSAADSSETAEEKLEGCYNNFISVLEKNTRDEASRKEIEAAFNNAMFVWEQSFTELGIRIAAKALKDI